MPTNRWSKHTYEACRRQRSASNLRPSDTSYPRNHCGKEKSETVKPAVMDWLSNVHDMLYAKMGSALYYAIGFITIIALLAQWRLYEKCRLPGAAAFVPVWNVIVFLKIVGRPAWQGWLFLIPIYGQLYFLPKVWIEVVQCFGKRSMLDYILVFVLNGLYILNLAMDDDNQYLGPLYGQQDLPKPTKLTPRPMMA